jgi:hypothetical protein
VNLLIVNLPLLFIKLLPTYYSAILYIKATVVSVCLSVVQTGQGRVARANTRPLDLLAARNNRLGGFLAVQTSNLHPNKNIYNKKTTIFLKKKIEIK